MRRQPSRWGESQDGEFDMNKHNCRTTITQLGANPLSSHSLLPPSPTHTPHTLYPCLFMPPSLPPPIATIEDAWGGGGWSQRTVLLPHSSKERATSQNSRLWCHPHPPPSFFRPLGTAVAVAAESTVRVCYRGNGTGLPTHPFVALQKAGRDG